MAGTLILGGCAKPEAVEAEKPETAEGEQVSNVWPFDQRMHLLMNLAWGGSWGGREGTDKKCLPAKLEVDYVRVYQSPEIMALTGQGTLP